MKRSFTQNLPALRVSALIGFATACILFSNISFGQTYYSRFANPTGKYQVTNPSGCDAPPIQNAIGIADASAGSYAYFAANISEPYDCDVSYTFDAYLNLPPDSPYVSPGNEAGWRIKIPTGISPDSLGKYIIISTYLDGVFQEYNTGNMLRGIETDEDGVSWFVYFTPSKPYNILELVVDPKIIQLNKNFVFQVFYALGSLSTVLPATIDNFKANVSGKSVNLSWESLTETNVENYRIERSSNGGVSYSTVATLPAKGNSSSTTSYGYTDNVSVDGSYLYRIVTMNMDGTSKATSSISAVISGQGKLVLYPSVVKAGQNIIVKTSEAGFVTVYMYDAQGRMVKQQRTNSAGQFTISTSGLSNGVYNVKVVSATGSVMQTKVIVN